MRKVDEESSAVQSFLLGTRGRRAVRERDRTDQLASVWSSSPASLSSRVALHEMLSISLHLHGEARSLTCLSRLSLTINVNAA